MVRTGKTGYLSNHKISVLLVFLRKRFILVLTFFSLSKTCENTIIFRILPLFLGKPKFFYDFFIESFRLALVPVFIRNYSKKTTDIFSGYKLPFLPGISHKKMEIMCRFYRYYV